MDRYNIYQKNDEVFEDIVWHICSKIFGIGVSKFPKGKDGGKDARLVGTAIAYPSTNAPWSGKIIIQAKFTGNVNATCSTPDFKRIMELEKSKIKSLKDTGDLTHYICFTNRKRTGIEGDRIEADMREVCGVDNLVIVGIDTIEQLLLSYPDLIDRFGLAYPAPGLQVHPQDLSALIEHFDKNLKVFEAGDAVRIESDFQHPGLPKKNAINDLSEDYFRDFVEEDSMPYMRTIEAFLKNPRNKDWLKRYQNVSAHLRHAYAVHRDKFGDFKTIFDDILNRLYLHGQEPANTRLAITFLHYMYCYCDLGLKVPKAAK